MRREEINNLAPRVEAQLVKSRLKRRIKIGLKIHAERERGRRGDADAMIKRADRRGLSMPRKICLRILAAELSRDARNYLLIPCVIARLLIMEILWKRSCILREKQQSCSDITTKAGSCGAARPVWKILICRFN